MTGRQGALPGAQATPELLGGRAGAPGSAATRTGRRGRARIAAVAGVCALALTAGTVLAVTYPAHVGCALGSPIGSYNVTTPSVVANFPNGGAVSVFANRDNWTFASGSLVFGGLPNGPGNFGGGFGSGPGGSGLLLSAVQPIFTVYSVRNVSTSASSAMPCTQPYIAEETQASYCGGGVTFGYPLANNSNDEVEPHVINVSCGPQPNASGILTGGYMWFDSAYPTSPAPGVNVTRLDLCGWSTAFDQPVRGGVGLATRLVVPYDGGWVSVSGDLWWESWGPPTAEYGIPAGSIWEVASIGVETEATVGLLPPGLLAFVQLPC